MTIAKAAGALANRSIRYVTLVWTPGSSTSSTFAFSGMAAGDLCIIFMDNRGNGQPPAPSGWTVVTPSPNWVATGNLCYLYYKALTAADISTGSVTFSGSPSVDALADVFTIAYRGPTRVANIQSVGTTATTVPLGGFTSPGATLGLLFMMYDHTGAHSFTPPSLTGLTSRINGAAHSSFTFGLYDLLAPQNYTNAGALGFVTTGSDDKFGWVVAIKD